MIPAQLHFNFNVDAIHPSWHDIVTKALLQVNQDYLAQLSEQHNWLPGPHAIFNAFKLPLEQTHFLLLGESPYPRKASANGFAFWDGAVAELWSKSGLSVGVNRATSLRNFIKMLLLAEGLLNADNLSQSAIAAVDKRTLLPDVNSLFERLLARGYLLLNASLVLSSQPVKKEAAAWYPFLENLLKSLAKLRPTLRLLLFGKVAQILTKMPGLEAVKPLLAPHPYNLSFIHDPGVLNFFKSQHLLCSN